MPSPKTAFQQDRFKTPNAERAVEVSRRELPVCCPRPDEALWNSHPRVFLPLREPGQSELCPYCGRRFTLVD